MRSTLRLSAAAWLVALGLALDTRAATITVVNMDGAGEGFNDPTPVAPVGGNPGTTLGAQRLKDLCFLGAADYYFEGTTAADRLPLRQAQKTPATRPQYRRKFFETSTDSPQMPKISGRRIGDTRARTLPRSSMLQ